ALDVLHDGQLAHVAIGHLVADQRGNAVPPQTLKGPEAALAGDDLVAVPMLAEEDRLDEAAQPDRLGQFVQLVRAELAPRLERVGGNERQLDFMNRGPRLRIRDLRPEVRENGIEAFTQGAP